MKSKIGCIGLVVFGIFAFSNAQAGVVYNCQLDSGRPEPVVQLTMSKKQILFQSQTFTNVTAVHSAAPYRSYNDIGTPWRDLTIPTEMLTHGKDGYVELLTSYFTEDTTQTVYYFCKRAVRL